MSNNLGKNRYPHDENWLTDGYGDYVRHYLRSLAFKPELAVSDQNHLLSSTSVIQLMEYSHQTGKFFGSGVPEGKEKHTLINYRTYYEESKEIFRMTQKPSEFLVTLQPIPETEQTNSEGWSWKPLEKGGILTVRHWDGNRLSMMEK